MEEKEQEDFGKKLFEFTELEIDEEVESALMECKVGFTWFDENVKELQDKLNDIGLERFRVTSLSNRKFLIRKDKKEGWEDWNNTDLSVWFCKIRDFHQGDNVISKVVWIECKGIPMPAWKDENLRALTSRFGEWISWTYQSDGLGEFFNPLVCIDTTSFEPILDDMKILYKGEQKKIVIREILDTDYLIGKVLPMEFSDNQRQAEKEISSRSNDSEVSSVRENMDKQKVDSRGKVDNQVMDPRGEEKKEETNAPGSNTSHILDKGVEDAIGTKGDTPKEKVIIDARQRLISSELSSELNHQEELISTAEICDPEEVISLQTDLCKDVSKKLRVKSNRGRPKKISAVPRNPFEIGIKFKGRKKKGNCVRNCAKRRSKQSPKSCLQLIPLGLSSRTVREALEIISSAENMGLVIKGDREEVIQAIARRLEKGEL
ncbi:hypothetical protein ACET3Z_005353 [Daucus carota]